MKKLLFVLLSVLFWGQLVAQTTKILGVIKDVDSKEVLTGVSISANKSIGTKSDLNGNYQLKLNEGTYQIRFSFTGYEEIKQSITVSKNENKIIDIFLKLKSTALNTVTISGSKFEKRAAEEIVSIEVIKPAQILNMANNTMTDALQRVPGVSVVESQVNIRGGSGWSYGAGSRVLVLVDDMPMMTADAGDAKWDFLPIENCEQIEVIKGASSSLYGSSALNGVVNFRTGFAKNKPKTKAMLYNGMYGNPKDKSWKWWGKQQPGFQGGYFMHAQKFGQLDFVLGSAWYSEDSYNQGDLQRRGRANMNLRYRFKNNPRLLVGINSNLQLNKSQTFFFWQPDAANGTKFYQPYGGLNDSTTTVNKNQGQRINIDPYIQLYSKGGAKHVLRTRFFRSKNDIPEKQQSSTADTYFGEYQYQKEIQSDHKILDQLHIVSGVLASYSNVLGELYGNHKTYNVAPYLQLEKKINKLWLNVGMRYEVNEVDTYSTERKPVFRTGLNYELSKSTFIRASFGQGYRYPSVAERFINTSFGPSKVFPNPGLKSETGWSSEIGVKQGYKIGSWLGYVDVAAFWMQYQNMMEFNFNFYIPKDSTFINFLAALDYLGFKSINVGNTRINGVDMSTVAQGKIGKISSRFMVSYTYMNPILLNPDSATMANVSGNTKTLKYRYRNSFKMDMEHSYKNVVLGSTILYNSNMQNIDAVFQNTKPKENLPGLLFEGVTKLPSSVNAFRTKYNKGSFVWDVRLAYQLSKQAKISLVIKNILNTVYSERPALIAPPRNFTLQLAVEL
jgi:outer membrane cobalamin receptor